MNTAGMHTVAQLTGNPVRSLLQAIHTRVDKLARRASQMEQQPDSDSQPEQAPVTSMQGPPDNLQHQVCDTTATAQQLAQPC
jgi:hypothetical protein